MNDALMPADGVAVEIDDIAGLNGIGLRRPMMSARPVGTKQMSWLSCVATLRPNAAPVPGSAAWLPPNGKRNSRVAARGREQVAWSRSARGATQRAARR
jgi:hypothetical protein